MAECSFLQFVSPYAFEAMQKVDVVRLAALSDLELRLLLPCLVRMALCAPADQSQSWAQDKKLILRLLSGVEAVNSIVALLSVDFHALEQDANKEQQLRHKLGGGSGDSILVSQLQHGLTLEFEHSDSPRRLRLVLSELLAIINKVSDSNGEFFLKSSELFESPVYLEEAADVLCILQAELPSLLPIVDVAEALLHVRNGAWFLCLLVANVPDSFNEVCRGLIKNGERQDEESMGGRRRTEALRQLCKMNPAQALKVRGMVVEECHLPGLGVALTLDHTKNESPEESVSDLVCFVSGLLLGTNAKVRTWFGTFIRNGQQRKKESSSSVLWQMRRQLLLELMDILPRVRSTHVVEEANADMEPSVAVYSGLKEEHVVKASALLRLYCALMGIAGLKPTDEEAEQVLQLMTSRPPATPAGVRFVSLSFCMLLAFSTLVSTPEQEQLMVVWLSWMIKEEAYFESTAGVSASFGEMLLLVAMYFHSNQLGAIIDLVCSTLGMKIVIKPGSLSRMKTIFTQEIFTEQVVTAHAVRVPVTSSLSGNITGFLPVHCIYQLLRSRSFTKHKVSIKDWIYRQLCETATPLHPQLLPLIDVYINSVLTPASKSSPEATNQPITEQEILSVFQGLTGGENPRRPQHSSITAQLLVLYYVLSFEEALLTSTKTLAAMQRKPKSYTSALMDQIPIKYLIRQAQGLQQELGGLHSALLRLLATNYPHLCIVEDWICEEEITGTDALLRRMLLTSSAKNHFPKQLQEAFSMLPASQTQVMQILEHLTLLCASELIPYAEVLTLNMSRLLNAGVPRRILQTVGRLWMVLNTVMPRRLWVMTVNALQPSLKLVKRHKYTQNDLMIDPLIVLRCDQRVYRCPPLMDITLHMLNGYLLASKAFLSAHLKETADQDIRSSQPNSLGVAGQTEVPEVTREELKNALLAAQDSAAIQILLEVCLPTEEERAQDVIAEGSALPPSRGLEEGEESLLCDLREVQCLICCLLHQMFIADPNIAKLVHFQGYPCELLALTAAGIPSMHICLDFIPELLAQPELEKQKFAIQLLSYLCIQYALPKSLSVARLAINVMGTLLTVLTKVKRYAFFMPTLPCLVSFCQAFPPLYEDIMSLLIQIGQVCASDVATQTRDIDPIITRLQQLKEKPVEWSGIHKEARTCRGGSRDLESTDADVQLCQCIESTIVDIINMSVAGV
ncbi:integrator complex subunit 2 isoform X1 [Rhinatrema bivittatum]|uniref:integrator complex subunit 2 isoform X1 n=1 Tax=Rhinatrema bivittatum TaxID=194408 RepID=UPI0011278EBC|nr:integrator complex subunit 2 isoform X1 [Rhinatrema bivittatum]XP_029467425.1 integrator complex subunit 2 isoform X1 [Rhinatrema bivittatum]XP_029467426.1 integrator complex subunit 2 isoform X1 [Rhinatrema bivittatum]XP_029467427.1 integrator complex subunit 2 isoform X1 [Rhinatrema bivittatum]XP_029467429.1 integrator complex subunit 2 isoform X1 [Rhinatrema bivittatum]